MIVFGDPSFTRPLAELVRTLANRLKGLSEEHSDPEVVREALIYAGQVEQAVADAEESHRGIVQLAILRHWCETATAALATMLVGGDAAAPKSKELLKTLGAAAAGCSWRKPAEGDEHVAKRKGGGARPPADASGIETLPATVSIPEGYAFYTLYPEQYARAACEWARANQTRYPGPVLILGLRSIGTSLSAIVTATLAHEGWRATRATVRPRGVHTSRSVDVPGDALRGVARVLVVDEGPGQSGTSFAATAEALTMAGFPRHAIAFLPSHANDLSAAATPRAREWWCRTPRFVTLFRDLRIESRTVGEHLQSRTRELLRQAVGEPVDMSGGLWRSLALTVEHEWPGVFGLLESEKYLIRSAVTERAVLWKFAGLATGGDRLTGWERALRRLQELASLNLTPAPLGSCQGFVGTEWIEGRRLTRGDLCAEVLAHAAHYLTAAPPPPLSPEGAKAAFDRAAHILYWNARKSLGVHAADRALELCCRVRSCSPVTATPAAPDGRLAPHEWVRTAGGAIVKCDAEGHADDHTAAGQQPLAWDIAGFAVEWNLSWSSGHAFAAQVATLARCSVSEQQLRFHRAAYAAFRLGCCAMGADSARHDDRERARLQRDQRAYEQQLAAALNRKEE